MGVYTYGRTYHPPLTDPLIQTKTNKQTQVTKEMENYMALLEKIKGMMEAKQPVRTGEWSASEVDNINEKLKELITTKSVCVYVFVYLF